MITYNWTISVLNCIPQTAEGADYVVTAHWRLTGTDGTYTGQVYSTCSFPVESKPDFTPFNQLTQQQVLGWIWTNGVDKDSAEAAVAQQIQNQITPPITTPALPWTV